MMSFTPGIVNLNWGFNIYSNTYVESLNFKPTADAGEISDE